MRVDNNNFSKYMTVQKSLLTLQVNLKEHIKVIKKIFNTQQPRDINLLCSRWHWFFNTFSGLEWLETSSPVNCLAKDLRVTQSQNPWGMWKRTYLKCNSYWEELIFFSPMNLLLGGWHLSKKKKEKKSVSISVLSSYIKLRASECMGLWFWDKI